MKAFCLLDLILKRNAFVAFLVVAVALFWGGNAGSTPVPDDQKAWLQIRGSGLSPSSEVVLSTGEKNRIAILSDKDGKFIFEKLDYYSFVPLRFRLDIPEYRNEMISVEKTSLVFDFDPNGSIVTLSGKAMPASSVVVNIDGVASDSRILGEKGTFEMQLGTPLGLADGTSEIVASIVNVGEACCPKLLVPAPPVQIVVSSIAIQKKDVPSPSVPAFGPRHSSPEKQPASRPSYIVPSKPETEMQENGVPSGKESPAKTKIPYLVTGSLSQEIKVDLPESSDAISFPSATYENTYVGGFKKLADQVRDAIVTNGLMIGAFLDGRSENASLSVLQKLNAQAMKDYAVSDSICKFGTLSRSIAGSEALVDTNKQAFSKIILDRNRQALNTLYSDPVMGGNGRVDDFKAKYCEVVDNNSGLKEYCKTSEPTNTDKYFNRDVDFTRVFDSPLTLDVNYTDNTTTPSEDGVIALFSNLSLQDAEFNTKGKRLADQGKSEDVQNLRQSFAIRQLVGNTFSNLVAMKAKGTAGSGTYMQKTLTKLGVSSADAKKLIGDNPSYFAQMEILTKKLYQDPSFYSNLYDNPSNVARQRVAIKAISLMQDRDLLESLKRREMLLSELLEMKLRKEARDKNLAGVSTD